MRCRNRSVVAGILAAFACAVAEAQGPLAWYQFNLGPSVAPTNVAAGVTASPVTLSAGTFTATETNVFVGDYFPDEPYIEESGGWTSAAPANAKAFFITLTPNVGKSITVTGLEFKAYATSEGPSAYSYDVAGVATGTVDAPNSQLVTNRFAISGVTSQSGPVFIQLQGWTNGTRSTTGAGAFKLDDVVVYGTVGNTFTDLQFVGSAATVSESAGSYTVTVAKTRAGGNLSAQLALGGTATLGADYTVSPTNLTLNGANTSATVVVTILNDAFVEGTETLVLTLTNVVGGGAVAPSVFTLTINDPNLLAVYRFNTAPYLAPDASAAGLTASVVSLFPSGTIETNQPGGGFADPPSIDETGGWDAASPASAKSFLLTLTPDPGRSITVTGLEYQAFSSPSGPSAFAYDVAGLATGSVDALDGLIMTNRFVITGVTSRVGAVTIQLQGWDNGSRVTAGSGVFKVDDLLVYGVVDSLPTNLQFVGSAASVNESSASYTVTVVKTVAGGNLAVQLALGGTATLGADYTVDTTNLVLNGATTSATVVVTVNDDATLEGPETVVLALTNAVGGGLVAPATFTLTISDPSVLAVYRFNAAPYLPATTNAAGLTASAVSLSSGSFATDEVNVTTGAYFPDEPYIEESDWTASSPAGAKAFLITLTPDAGKLITVTGLSFKAYAVGSGPSAISYDVAGLASGTINATNDVLRTNDFVIAGVATQAGALLIKIEGWTNGTRSTTGLGAFRLDDVLVYGFVQSTNNSLADADGDLMPDAWEVDNFGGSTTNGAGGDNDGDGFSNLEEYIAGTQPTNGLSYLKMAGIANASGASVSFFGVTGRLYRLDYSEDLLNAGGWIEYTNSIPGTNGLMLVPQGDAATNRDYRVHAQLP